MTKTPKIDGCFQPKFEFQVKQSTLSTVLACFFKTDHEYSYDLFWKKLSDHTSVFQTWTGKAMHVKFNKEKFSTLMNYSHTDHCSAEKVDLRTVSFDVPPQEVLSRDSVTVSVDAVVYYRVSNPTMATNNIEDYRWVKFLRLDEPAWHSFLALSNFF